MGPRLAAVSGRHAAIVFGELSPMAHHSFLLPLATARRARRSLLKACISKASPPEREKCLGFYSYVPPGIPYSFALRKQIWFKLSKNPYSVVDESVAPCNLSYACGLGFSTFDSQKMFLAPLPCTYQFFQPYPTESTRVFSANATNMIRDQPQNYQINSPVPPQFRSDLPAQFFSRSPIYSHQV